MISGQLYYIYAYIITIDIDFVYKFINFIVQNIINETGHVETCMLNCSLAQENTLLSVLASASCYGSILSSIAISCIPLGIPPLSILPIHMPIRL